MPDRLRQVHPVVYAHDDLFPQDTDDEVWLREAARRGWIVLTRDDRIRYRPGEQKAILEAGVACFCLNPTKGMKADGWAEVLVRALPRILSVAAAERRRGYIKGVNRRGQIRHLFPRGRRKGR
ncbi:MAG: hypothetical protein ACRDHV_00460 [Actinomycetota bacterium]